MWILIQKFFYLQYLFGIILVSSNVYVLHGIDDSNINRGSGENYSLSTVSLECTADSSCPTWNYCSSGRCHRSSLPHFSENHSVCNWFNRKGLLCGECEDGFSPFVLSYNFSFVNCTDGYKNWWKFSVIAFAPVTCFVVIFQINVTSSHLHGVVWFSQTISMPPLMRFVMVELAKDYPQVLTVVRAFVYHCIACGT